MSETQGIFTRLLLGGDLRRLQNNKKVIAAVHDQQSFDALFGLIFHHERPLVMRAADAVEKISKSHPDYLQPHKEQLLSVFKSADHKELKWHIAQLVPRLKLSPSELKDTCHILTYWALNQNESKIVRVNSLQGLFDLSIQHPDLQADTLAVIHTMEKEMVPSIQARIRKLKGSIQ
jgi:hypothetical protein